MPQLKLRSAFDPKKARHDGVQAGKCPKTAGTVILQAVARPHSQDGRSGAPGLDARRRPCPGPKVADRSDLTARGLIGTVSHKHAIISRHKSQLSPCSL